MLIGSIRTKIFIYNQACDMRKSIDKLSQVVGEEFENNIMDGDIYLFMNKKRDKIKILYWEKNGFWLCYKRLEKELFKMPKIVGKANGNNNGANAVVIKWIKYRKNKRI